jgi:acyl carrier protein
MTASLKMPTIPKEANAARVEEQALEIIRGLLTELGSHRAAQSVSLNSSMDRELGLGSLERVELLVRFESEFGVRLPDEIAQQADTPAEWVQTIVQARDVESSQTPGTRSRYHIEHPVREAPPAPESARNWPEVLRWHAEGDPQRVHVHLLENDICQDISYGQLLDAASRVASGLIAAGLRRDETVAIMLPTCADFFYAFFGVMLAGGIAVPIYPPARPDKIEEYVRRQVSILRNAEVRFLIGFDRAKAVSKIIQLKIPSLIDITTVDELRKSGGKLPPASAGPSDIAFIQYTSGSTGEPKGVVLSQFNVLANVRGIGWAVKVRPTDIVVSWLPLYHDMGLIGSWLFSVYYALPITVFSPLDFLSRPERWLWALHDSRGTLCPAPNFAYELSARKISDQAVEGLDLSRWRVAINAGEAVLAETLMRFAQRFEPYGFRPESYVPCYGLAESSVALTFPPIGRRPVIDTVRRDIFETKGQAVPALAGDSNALRFVANGRPLPEHEVKIVDEQGRELDERIQGRLFFRGLSKTAGYFHNPDATAAAITDDGWVDSGDLAYWANGELYITGRSKDCIIKSGRNIIPQEVESAASEVEGVRRGCVAAFGSLDCDAGTERLVVVAETRAASSDEFGRIEAEIVKTVDAVLGIPPDKVVLVPPHSIPKTSSGKIRRHETRSLYANGKLKGARKPPWFQFVRLALGNLGAWFRSAIKRLAARLQRAYLQALRVALTRSSGMVVRIVPGRRAAARIVQSTARWILRLSRERVGVLGSHLIPPGQPVVLFANCVGRLDPLLLAGSIPSPFLIADASHLASLPRDTAFLLRRVVLAPLDGAVAPPGGTLRQRIRQGLDEGHSILVLPDGPAGAPPHLSRFRLDAIHAAVVSSVPIHPVGVRGTSRLFEWEGAGRKSANPVVVIGEPIRTDLAHQRELVALRERVREAIVKLCRPRA